MDPKRIAWHTRRGIKEVEMLLIPFFENYYDALTDHQQTQFQKLLSCHDAELFSWLLENTTPKDPELQAIINEIRRRHHNQTQS